MGLFVACKNEEDPITSEGARVVTTLLINFSDAQGQLTLKSVMNLAEFKLIQALIATNQRVVAAKRQQRGLVAITIRGSVLFYSSAI